MSRYQAHGYYDTTATDGRPLRIIFQHRDDDRTEEDVVRTVMVLREFAADCTAGIPDANGRSPDKEGRPCDVILAHESGLHPSNSDPNPHTSIQVASNEYWNQNPRLVRSGYHVYSRNNDIAQGYRGWFRTKRSSKSRQTSPKILEDIRLALQNDMRRPASPPKPPTPPKQPSPPPSGAVGYMADGRTPVYWSKSQAKYYWQGADQVKHACAGPGSKFPSPSESSTASSTAQASTSGNNSEPAGYMPNGTPYYYSTKQQQHYYYGSDGKKHGYNPKK